MPHSNSKLYVYICCRIYEVSQSACVLHVQPLFLSFQNLARKLGVLDVDDTEIQSATKGIQSRSVILYWALLAIKRWFYRHLVSETDPVSTLQRSRHRECFFRRRKVRSRYSIRLENNRTVLL